MDRRKEVPEAKQCSDYERLRFRNIGRNHAFLESLGVPKLGLEPQKEKQPHSDKKRKTQPDVQQTQPPRKSARQGAQVRVLPVLPDTVALSKPVQLRCKFCLILSFTVPRLEADAWLVKHLESNVTCIEIRKKDIAFEVHSLVHTKLTRFDMST